MKKHFNTSLIGSFSKTDGEIERQYKIGNCYIVVHCASQVWPKLISYVLYNCQPSIQHMYNTCTPSPLSSQANASPTSRYIALINCHMGIIVINLFVQISQGKDELNKVHHYVCFCCVYFGIIKFNVDTSSWWPSSQWTWIWSKLVLGNSQLFNGHLHYSMSMLLYKPSLAAVCLYY